MFNQQAFLGTDDPAWKRKARESQPYGPFKDGSHLSDIGTWPFHQSIVVPRWVGDHPRVAALADNSIEAGAASGVWEHGWNVTPRDSRKRADVTQEFTDRFYAKTTEGSKLKG